jgi:hypothetical protein
MARPQGVPVTPSSPSRTRSPEPQVAGEALVDDARIATLTRGMAEGLTTSPPVTDTRAGSCLHTAEGVETSVGEVGVTTSPTVVDVDPIRAIPNGARDVAEDQPQIDLAPGGPEASGAQVPPYSTPSLRLPRRQLIGITPLGRMIGSRTMRTCGLCRPASSPSTTHSL